MTTTISAAALFIARSATDLLNLSLDLARVAGLPVDSWRVGDPTRSNYENQAEALGATEEIAAAYARSGFLSTAEGDWLDLHALEVYGATVPEATPATPRVTVRNDGPNYYPLAAGDLTFRSTATGATYHSTTGGTLSSGAVVEFETAADEAGSVGTVGPDGVDEIVTARLGLVVVSSTAAAGVDRPTPEQIRTLSRESLGVLSPDGPADAYSYVARTEALTGTSEVTRARAAPDSATGAVVLYVAGPSGAVTAEALALVEAAVLVWATPLCHTPSVINASAQSIDLSVTLYGPDVPASAASTISTALAQRFAVADIGADVPHSKLIQWILEAVPEATSLDVDTMIPADDVTLADNAVPTLGTVSVVLGG